MQVRGHLGPLVGTDALAPLLHERRPQPPEPRAEHQPEPTEDHRHREEALAEGAERTLRGQERAHSGDDERAADDDPQDRRGLGCLRVVARRAPVAAYELADELVDRATAATDDQRGAHRREHDRPEQRVC